VAADPENGSVAAAGGNSDKKKQKKPAETMGAGGEGGKDKDGAGEAGEAAVPPARPLLTTSKLEANNNNNQTRRLRRRVAASDQFKPAPGVKVELWEQDTFNFDDKLDATETDKQGHFTIRGMENELNYIRPYLWLLHSCPSAHTAAYNNSKCKFAQRIPLPHFAINSTHHLGSMVFGGSIPHEKIICE